MVLTIDNKGYVNLEQIVIEKHQVYSRRDVPIKPSKWNGNTITGRELAQDLQENQGYVTIRQHAKNIGDCPTGTLHWRVRENPALAIKVVAGENSVYLLTPKAQKKLNDLTSLTDYFDYEAMIASIDKDTAYNIRSLAAACDVNGATILRFMREGMPAKITGRLRTGKVNRKYREIKGEDAIKFFEWRRNVYSLNMLSLKTGYDTEVLGELADEGFLKIIKLGKKKTRYVHVEDVELLKARIAEYRLPQPAKRGKFAGNKLFDYLIELRKTKSASDFTPQKLETEYRGISAAIYRRFKTFPSALEAVAEYLTQQGDKTLARRFHVNVVYAERTGMDLGEIEKLLIAAEKKGLSPDEVLKDFNKPALTEEEKQEIVSLSRIVLNSVLAKEYSRSVDYIITLSIKKTEEKVTRVAFSDRRIELSLPLYNCSENERVRRIILENVFNPLAKDIAQHVSDAPDEFFTPYFGLYTKLFGLSQDNSKKITEAITQKITRYVTQLLVQYAENDSELPNTVRSKEETITQWIFRKAREHFAAQFPKRAAKEFDKMLNVLSEQDYLIISMKYQLAADLSENSYQGPSHREIAKLAGVHYTSISDREREIVGRLMHAENIEKVIGFMDVFKNYLRRCNAKPAA
ncbi:TPA: hypothetical protein HA246_04350 [Candidatus Woesearchaeota archaeon]|nr:hypothetical protein [Candidatus Woesearchaeota archaeon]